MTGPVIIAAAIAFATGAVFALLAVLMVSLVRSPAEPTPSIAFDLDDPSQRRAFDVLDRGRRLR